MRTSGEPYLIAKQIEKAFTITDGVVPVLKGIDLTIKKGEFVIIFGPSGCGKSTLLHTLLGLEPPTGGQLHVDAKDFYSLNEDERASYRRFHYGIIYQQPLWIGSLDVKDNVAFALHLMDLTDDEIKTRVMKSLELVGMEKWADYHPMELSSGQQQKISLARAMTLDPVLLVADEPTGNLDTVSGQELIENFCKLSEGGKTIIMVTHDLEYLRYGTHLVHMVDGKVVEEEFPKNNNTYKKIAGKKGTNTTAPKVGDANVRDADFLKRNVS